jgi:alpha-1,2-mannosyltransferase
MPVSQPAKRRIAVVVALWLVTAGAHIWYGNRHNFLDLRIYDGAVRWWAHGHRLYDFAVPDKYQGSLGFTYPPFAAVVMYPMAWLPVVAVIAVMFVVSVAAIVITTGWLVAPVARRHGWPVWYALGLAIPLVTVLEPIRETVTFGQINLVLALLILGDLLVVTRRGSRWAGVGIGLAAAIKLTPAIFIGYLLLTRRTRPALTAMATAAAATLVAVAVHPADSWRYWTRVLWQASRVGHLDQIPNQSLLGLLYRVAYPHPANRVLWLALAAVALALGMWRAALAGRRGDEVAGLALTGMTGSLVSPVSWQHHLYWFVPALVVLVDVAASRPAPHRRWYLGLAVLVWFTVTFSVIAWFDWGILPSGLMHTPVGWLVGDWHLLLMVLLLAVLPIRAGVDSTPRVAEEAPGAAATGDRVGARSTRPGPLAQADP